ncbi:MAG: hypothetical protein JJU02_00345, partial [Cryomorphaceae bacterium]|nr:hypothetical protein [Cryomorphaceae bacterium]
QEFYWRDIYVSFSNFSRDEKIYLIEKLSNYERHLSALTVCLQGFKDLPSELLVETAINAAIKTSKENIQIREHEVGLLFLEFEKREDIDSSQLFNLEWMYINFLTSSSSRVKPKRIYDKLLQSPEYFCKILSYIYMPESKKDSKEDISPKAKQRRGEGSFSLLNSWKKIPGIQKGNIIDEEVLWSWVNEVRRIAKEIDREKVADMHIGKILAEYPADLSPWPPEIICRLIDRIDSESLISGFSAATFNKRGQTVRGPFDGGSIEWDYASFFRENEKRTKPKFPVTSGILKKLADGYEHDARRRDKEAQRDELDY